jgi:hypothetical protein
VLAQLLAPHPPVGLLFLAADASAPTGPVAGPLDTAVAVGAPVGTTAGAAGPYSTAAAIDPWAPVDTAAGAPAWPSFDPSMGGISYWSTAHAFFATPQYGFPMQPAWPSSLDPSMGGAPYWSTPRAFFMAP